VPEFFTSNSKLLADPVEMSPKLCDETAKFDDTFLKSMCPNTPFPDKLKLAVSDVLPF
jgi:NADPH-dependent 7-cyano-7-deazaguanine reductase QueF